MCVCVCVHARACACACACACVCVCEGSKQFQTVTGWSFDKEGLSCQYSQVKCSMLQAEQIYL